MNITTMTDQEIGMAFLGHGTHPPEWHDCAYDPVSLKPWRGCAEHPASLWYMRHANAIALQAQERGDFATSRLWDVRAHLAVAILHDDAADVRRLAKYAAKLAAA